MKPNRREFLTIAGTVGLACGRVLSAAETPSRREDKPGRPGAAEGRVAKSKIRVAQIKLYPEKGKMAVNHRKLVGVLGDIEKVGATHASPVLDVVVTPEGFLDGYVSTEQSVTKAEMVNYAIDPGASEYTLEASAWARRNETWLIYGCTRKEKDQVFNTALIYDRSGSLVGMYDKLHLQKHDLKYAPGKYLNVYESDFGRFGVMICADRRWPETARTLTLRGARVIFNPTYGMRGDLNLCMMRMSLPRSVCRKRRPTREDTLSTAVRTSTANEERS